MIKAVIFDCFGVLTTESFDIFRTKYFAGQPEKRQQANSLMDQLNAAQISYQEFLLELAKLSGLTKEKVEKYLSENKTNEPLFDVIRNELKPKYKIGLLSNAGANWLEELFGAHGVALFDDVILSYEHGMLKPNPGIYKLAAQRLGVDTKDCIFVDDNPKHCEGAEAAGMHAIYYKYFEQFNNELWILLSGKR